MSDATLPPGGPDRDLLFGVLALQLDFVSPAELQLAMQAWYADRSGSLPQLLVERGVIGKTRVGLIERLADEFLKIHGGDEGTALSAACAARSMPLDLEAFTVPAVRGEMATLEAELGTLPGRSSPPMPDAAASPGRRFRVVRSHARGALGEVFLAVDEELHREVALKEMQAPFARSRESRARFLLEAEITGQLEHPGIVPIYGLGVHPDGRPFYAMRFIRGETLHDAIERFHLADRMGREPSERQMALRGLLTRFVSVCNAVAYAHSRGILHRDIKPGNIMLGPYQETLVVDWGLAKALGRPDREDSAELPILPTSANPGATMLGTVVGTPAFMSPEQASGKQDALGPGSDVYALGATLYAILTGEPPFQGEQASEILERVRRQDFVPPRRKNCTVPPGLEAIVLKAMAEAPGDRYPGASELGEDVERWLADEPVSAYPEPIAKRAQRWAKRHKLLVGGAGALVLTALVGLMIGMWLLGRANDKLVRAEAETARERDLAKEHLELARKAVDDCFVLATTDPMMQQERMRDARRLLLEKALPFYSGFRHRRPDDVELQADEARHLFRVAFIMNEVGKLKEALEAYEKARDAYAALASRYPDDGHKEPLGETWNNLGNVCFQLGRKQAALEAYQEALTLRKPLAEANPEDVDAQLNLSETVNNLNAIAMLDGDLETAAMHLADVERIARKMVDEKKDLPRSLRTLGAALHNLGNVLVKRERYKEAETAYTQAIDAQRRLVELGGRLTRPRSELASTLASFANLLDKVEKSAEALKMLTEARSLRAALAEEYREFPEFLYELAVVDDLIGTFYADDSKPALSMEAYRRALKAVASLAAEYRDEPRYRRLKAQVTMHIANATRDLDKPEEAMARYAEALAILHGRRDDEGRPIEILVHVGRAKALTALKRHAEAVTDWERARQLDTSSNAVRWRVYGTQSRIRAGDLAGAMKEAAELGKILDEARYDVPAPAGAYELGCLWALVAAGSKGDEAERCAKRAMEYLHRAKDGKLFESEDYRKNLLEDQDLKALYERPDYKAFVAGLGK